MTDQINTVMHLCTARPGEGLADRKQLLIHLLIDPVVFFDESLVELQHVQHQKT